MADAMHPDDRALARLPAERVMRSGHVWRLRLTSCRDRTTGR